jgi:lipopolysaccharide biosynthesis glycosyltransferase
MIRVFIGYDSREPVAYHVAAHSILRRASAPVSITPLVQDTLRSHGLYWRERAATESTEFSLTRFLVPYLADYTGRVVFMDSDVLCLGDIVELVNASGDDAPVSVVQHDYTPKSATKMDGQTQTTYPRKNWSSLMVFNADRCRTLTPLYVNDTPGLVLHRLVWAPRVARLSPQWNWLVGEYPPNPFAKILHYTLGGPWFAETRDTDHAKEWLAEFEAMTGRPYGD